MKLIVGRYRGFAIEAHMEPRTVRSSDGVALRYRVAWSLHTRTLKEKVIGDFADPVIYDSESVALTCVDRNARTLIDAMLADGFERGSVSLLPSTLNASLHGLDGHS
ncbi:hypothetical protein VSR68_41225 [Paraburkholderia phymatum]|uniref:hypothetical protein n=1 Tax=Paraburkholderia phymatum TaxID=148447 RepID=UPI00317E2CC2